MCEDAWVEDISKLPPYGETVWVYDARRGIVILGWYFPHYWMTHSFGKEVLVTAWKRIEKPGYPEKAKPKMASWELGRVH
jgi:hypothetical protein